MTHTKAPWRVDGVDNCAQPIVSAEHFEIATCWHHGVGSIEQEAHANAHLIAAAPDMLEALKLYDKYKDTPSDRGGINGPKGMAHKRWYLSKIAAIAKAEGKS